MRRMWFTKWFGLSLAVFLLLPPAIALASDGDVLIGEEVSFFTLPLLKIGHQLPE